MNIISLGAGVQSTVMALMAAHGEIEPMPDCAIFADTGWEPQAIYEHLDWLETQLPFPVYRVSGGNIRSDIINSTKRKKANLAHTPFYVEGGGLGRRQCTRVYKIDPIRRKIRELLGVSKGKRVPKHLSVEQWIGISTDEATRMKPSWDKWCENRWPLIEADMSRQNCINWFEKKHTGRKLEQSSCIGCPFHNDVLWRELKINHPAEFADAAGVDKKLRTESPLGGMKKMQFMHRSLKPLDEVDLRNLEDMGQLNMFNNECEGMCGV